jgi:ribosomal protein S18 acetylase RimI-like enzyme
MPMPGHPLVTGHAAWVALAAPPPGISFAREEGRLDPAEYTAAVRASGLVRPVDDAARMAAMVAGSNLIVTARDEAGRLVGAARSVTDFAYGCYLSDLCVDPAGQGRGIGRGLIAETKRILGPGCMLLLLSAPDPMTWYPRLGMERVENGFIIRRDG